MLMRSLAVTSVVLLASLLVPGLGSAGDASPTDWQAAGTTLQYVGTTALHSGADESPLNWLTLSVTVTSADAHNISLVLTGSDLETTHSISVTYDLATRKEAASDSYAYLWINPSDIAAGQAQIGDHTAVLLVNTPSLVEFSDGQADYWYDHASGVLVRAENVFNPAAAELVTASE
jgi:hypothetical protein